MAVNVRYVKSSNGIIVRDAAAGSEVTTLNYGDIMYDVIGIPNVIASLGGTSYVWAKVHYYTYNNATAEGEGWIATANAPVVSTTIPTKSMVYNSDSVLKQHERLTNARYIYNYLKNKGWSSNAIFAMLGNMEEESYINPGKWEYDEDGNRRGYGLTQWTPSTKYTDWLSSGADKSDIDNQLERILYEASTGSQWIKGNHSPAMTFSEFTTSKQSVAVLAEYFLRCYEHPANASSKVAGRQANAAKWSTLIWYLV